MQGTPFAQEAWINAGWTQCDPLTPFSTFMKAIPRSHPPPQPAGLSRCSAEALERWESGDFKFPPYQYKRGNLVVDAELNLRYLDSSERELLLGFGRDHTLFAWPANQIKEDPGSYENKRLSMCGDSFSMLSFGWLISQLCHPWEKPRSPQQIINRFGLASGASACADLAVPLLEALNEVNLTVPERNSGQLVGQIFAARQPHWF